MNWNRKVGLLLGAAVMSFAAGSLKAADFMGSFTLPSQTQWGLATLPSGDYTFSSVRGKSGLIQISQGAKCVALVMHQGINQASSSGPSSLHIVEGRVRSLHLAFAGLTYNFQPHGAKGKILARNTTVPGVAVAAVAARPVATK